MYTSMILGQIFGITFVGLGLSMLNKKWTSTAVENIATNPGIMWLVGLVTLLLGSLVVVLNNVWISGLPLIITIVGWLMLLKGGYILLFPHSAVHYYKKLNRGSIFMWGGVIAIILGLVLFLY